MYLPEAFHETRDDALVALMRAYPFATLVTADGEALEAEHLPLLTMADGSLRGHVAAGNPLARADGAAVLAIFHGPDAYVSPNWYPSRYETGREVPTWNYAVIHLHGHLRVTRDRAWLRALLEDLTDRHERGLAQPWHMADAPADHIETALGAIVGLEIKVERMTGKFKLSQNHPERNRRGVIEGLRQRDGDHDGALASLMLQREKDTGAC